MKRPGLKELGFAAALAGVAVGGAATERHFSQQAAQEAQKANEVNTLHFIKTSFSSLEDQLKTVNDLSPKNPLDVYETMERPGGQESAVTLNQDVFSRALHGLQDSYLNPYSIYTGRNMSLFNSPDWDDFYRINPKAAKKFKTQLEKVFTDISLNSSKEIFDPQVYSTNRTNNYTKALNDFKEAKNLFESIPEFKTDI